MRDSLTISGQPIQYLHPEGTRLKFRDVFPALSNICRYNGMVDWKLIKHLALCTELAEHYYKDIPSIIFYAAIHDFSEVYLGDVVAGLKKHLTDYKQIECLWETWVYNEFGVREPSEAEYNAVKFIDLRALALEMSILQWPIESSVLVNISGYQRTETESKLFKHVLQQDNASSWSTILGAIQEMIGDDLGKFE